MAAELVWDPQARLDLLEIYLTIGLDNPAAAERIYTRIETKVNLLVDHPRLGPRRPDIRPNTQIMVERPYLVLYQTHPDADDGPVDTVEIVRVVDARRDMTNLF